MKRSTTPHSSVFRGSVSKSIIVSAAVLAVVTAPMQVLNQTPAHAVDYEAQKSALRKQINNYKNKAGDLSKEADTLKSKLAKLSNEKATIQSQIDLSQAEHDSLKQEIKANEKKIAENRRGLGETLASMYVSGNISSLEVLASSDSLGDYVDKQEYQATIRDNITTTIDDINALKKKLEQQKIAVERTLKNQKNQRQLLADKEAEKAKILAETKGKESSYKKLVADKKAELSAVQAAQARSNCEASGGNWSGGDCIMPSLGGSGVPSGGIAGGGGYPGVWANAPLDAYVDPWGLYTRECVSYVAWKLQSQGKFVPHFGGAGNANQWPATTSNYGIPNGSTPKAGAAAVMPIGYYGHVMYVESVNGDGTITVSDYNLAWDGLYRKYTRSASGLTYIYFK